jgi:hypothetical protein
MINLQICSYGEITAGERYHILVVDSRNDSWDAEKEGTEPGYNLFAPLLFSLIQPFAHEHPIRAAFVERVAPKLRLVSNEDDFERLLAVRHRPWEWLFFDIGNPSAKRIFDYEPYYLYRKYHDFDLDVFRDSLMAVYHGMDVLYAEFISSKTSAEEMEHHLHNVLEQPRFSKIVANRL